MEHGQLIKQEEQIVLTIKNRLASLRAAVKREEEEHKKATALITRAQEAQDILQHLAQAVQQQAHKRLSKVVSSALEAVFGEDAYTFNIVFDRKRGRTEALLKFVRNGLEVDPLTASGGGAVDVAALALRISCIILHRPRLSRLVVLDEPLKYVSAEYRDNVRSMLEQLATDLDIQILMVTHSEELACGKIIRLG